MGTTHVTLSNKEYKPLRCKLTKSEMESIQAAAIDDVRIRKWDPLGLRELWALEMWLPWFVCSAGSQNKALFELCIASASFSEKEFVRLAKRAWQLSHPNATPKRWPYIEENFIAKIWLAIQASKGGRQLIEKYLAGANRGKMQDLGLTEYRVAQLIGENTKRQGIKLSLRRRLTYAKVWRILSFPAHNTENDWKSFAKHAPKNLRAEIPMTVAISPRKGRTDQT